MFEAIQPGLSAKWSVTVEEVHTAAHWGSGGVDVFATPQLIGLMETAAVAALDHLLPPGYCSVGTRVDIKHLAATPVGDTITAAAEIVEVDGRRIVFQVEAHDSATKVGEGRHERFVVNLERFMAKCARAASDPKSPPVRSAHRCHMR